MGYIDPGMFGLIAQIGSVVLLAVTSALLVFLKPLKATARRIFKRQPKSDADTEDSSQ